MNFLILSLVAQQNHTSLFMSLSTRLRNHWKHMGNFAKSCKEAGIKTGLYISSLSLLCLSWEMFRKEQKEGKQKTLANEQHVVRWSLSELPRFRQKLPNTNQKYNLDVHKKLRVANLISWIHRLIWRKYELLKSKEKLTPPHVFLWSLAGPWMMIPCIKHSTYTQSDSQGLSHYIK